MLKLNYPEIYTNVDECFKHLENNYNNDVETTAQNFHCYWYGNILDKQITSIKSFLVTQPKKYKVNLWIDKDNGWKYSQKNMLLNQIRKYIIVKCYDYDYEKKNTEYEKHTFIGTSARQRSYIKNRADKFRYLILHKYGGLYFDLDCIFLRSFEPIINLNIEFCYQWSLQTFGNNAIMRIKKNSIISKNILKKTTDFFKTHKQENNTFQLIKYIFTMTNYKNDNFYILPCTFFDPIWIIEDSNKKIIIYHLINLMIFLNKYKLK